MGLTQSHQYTINIWSAYYFMDEKVDMHNVPVIIVQYSSRDMVYVKSLKGSYFLVYAKDLHPYYGCPNNLQVTSKDRTNVAIKIDIDCIWDAENVLFSKAPDYVDASRYWKFSLSIIIKQTYMFNEVLDAVALLKHLKRTTVINLTAIARMKDILPTTTREYAKNQAERVITWLYMSGNPLNDPSLYWLLKAMLYDGRSILWPIPRLFTFYL